MISTKKDPFMNTLIKLISLLVIVASAACSSDEQLSRGHPEVQAALRPIQQKAAKTHQ